MTDSNPYSPPGGDPREKIPHEGPPAHSVDQVDDDAWQDWPTCPGCDRRRQTVCPICDTPGIDFPLLEFHGFEELIEQADQAKGESCGCGKGDDGCGKQPDEQAPQEQLREEELMLMCPTCDEAFHPKFYRLCPWCDNDFGSGIEPEQTFFEKEHISPRVLIALIGVGIVIVGGLIYMALL